MDSNVFSSLSKYNMATSENYLTEALVFITRLFLKRDPDMGLELAELLCGQPQESYLSEEESIAISTQITTNRGRPDIEIREGEDRLVYIEVKHDSPLGARQLERYKRQLEESGVVDTRLVLLARSQSFSHNTQLEDQDYHVICWYEIYNWLSCIDTQDDVCRYFASSFMTFLEEKGMSMKRVSWEYIRGIPALLNLIDMLEVAITEVVPDAECKRTAGWHWRGLYLEERYWCGVRFDRPLLVVFEDNRGYDPVTYKRDLDLTDKHFFSLGKDEQFECLVDFVQTSIKDLSDTVSGFH